MNIRIPQYTDKLYCLVHRGGPVSQLISSLEECVPQVPTKLLYRGSRCDLGGYLRKVFLRAMSRFPLCSLFGWNYQAVISRAYCQSSLLQGTVYQ